MNWWQQLWLCGFAFMVGVMVGVAIYGNVTVHKIVIERDTWRCTQWDDHRGKCDQWSVRT